MAVTYSGNYTSLSANTTTSLTVPYPTTSGGANPQNGSLLICILSYVANTTSATVAMSGWTQELSIGGLYCFSKQGDGSMSNGVMVFTGDTVHATAAILLFDGTATSSPTDGENTATTGGAVHAVSGFTTTKPNGLLLGAWTAITNLTGFTYAMGGQVLQFVTANKGFTPVPGLPLTICYDALAAAGATGARQCVSYNPLTGLQVTVLTDSFMIALAAFDGPSIPVITAPVDGENIAIGRIYDITWTPATDPAIAQSSLTYNLDYSLNDGTSWTQLDDFTAAGVTTFAWNTSGLTPTTQAKLRIRAHNGTDYSVGYDTTGRFTLSADVAPLAPSNMRGEQPDGTSVALFDIGVALVIKGTFNDPGDVMTSFDLDWGTDGATYPNTSTNASAVLSKTYAGSVFSAGTVYFRCRTEDYAGTPGPYATFSLNAAAAPAAPNITAPTAGAPPASATPTHTWTSVGQVKYRIRIVKAAVTVYDGGYISSTATSVAAPYSYQNSTTYTFFLSIEDSNGLRSTEDSETFTASYTGPSTPTLTVTPFDDSGYNEILISNPDVPAYNDLYRYLATETTDDAIKIASRLPVDGTFQDYSVISGVGYKYFVQAVNSAGGFTNSVVSSTITLTLTSLWLHVVQEAVSVTANAVAGQIVSLNNLNAEYEREILSARKRARGRTRLVTIIGQTEVKKLRYQVILTDADVTVGKLLSLEAIFGANALVCCRDQRANRLFGKLTNLPLAHDYTRSGLVVEVTEEDHDEGL